MHRDSGRANSSSGPWAGERILREMTRSNDTVYSEAFRQLRARHGTLEIYERLAAITNS